MNDVELLAEMERLEMLDCLTPDDFKDLAMGGADEWAIAEQLAIIGARAVRERVASRERLPEAGLEDIIYVGREEGNLSALPAAEEALAELVDEIRRLRGDV